MTLTPDHQDYGSDGACLRSNEKEEKGFKNGYILVQFFNRMFDVCGF